MSISIASTSVGSGPGRIAFLHGLFGRGKNFTTAAKALADEHTSLLVDLPDHGASGWTDTFSFVTYADLVAEHLRAGFAAEGPVDVVGHSLGGKVSMVLALRHPDLVRRLVVEDISPVHNGTLGNFLTYFTALDSLDLAHLGSRGEANEAIAEAIPDDGVRGFLLQNLRREGDGWSWQPNLELLKHSLGEIADFPDMGDVQFNGPTLWMGGERSDYIRPGAEERMRQLFPRTVSLTIKGAGHWIHSEKPEAFNTSLQRFLGAS